VGGSWVYRGPTPWAVGRRRVTCAGPTDSSFLLCSRHHGSRQRLCPWSAGRDPRQFAVGTDGLQSDGRLPQSGLARERTFAVADLASFYGGSRTVGDVLRRMRCSAVCGGRVGAAWLVTGSVLKARVKPRRVALLGPETRE
jgi:hypothetical protein